MPMRKFLYILLVLPLLGSCSDKEDVLPQQRTKIESYLSGSHRPQLVPESEVPADELASTSNYYTQFGDAVYRYIANINDPDRVNRAEITATSRAVITFRMYVFSYANIPDTQLPDYTNDATLKLAYGNAGMDVIYWPFVPYVVDMSRTDILKGLRKALMGCHEGDVVEVYMTYNMAYGDGLFSIIPEQSPVYFYITIDTVE